MMRDLSMHLLDIAQNSIVAKATKIDITIEEDINNNIFSMCIEDNGYGMSEETLQKVRSPFATSRTTRKVGLGIPMLEQTCIQCGGRLELTSKINVGTKIKAIMQYDNLDRPPLGDIGGDVFILIITNPLLDFVYEHSYNEKIYSLSTIEIKELLGDVPLTEPSVMEWIKGNITEGLSEIRQK